MLSVAVSGLPQSLSEKDVRRVLRRVFRVTKKKEVGCVSVNCISDAKMKKLNKVYRGKNSTTDVLSFGGSGTKLGISFFKKLLPSLVPDPDFGDIFISPSYVKKNAKKQGILFKEEMLRMVAHGMLHLMGYDHASLAQEKKMFALQERALVSDLN